MSNFGIVLDVQTANDEQVPFMSFRIAELLRDCNEHSNLFEHGEYWYYVCQIHT